MVIPPGPSAQHQAADDGDEVVEVVVDADCLGPRTRDEKPDDVAADDAEHAEVERWGSEAEESVLVEL